MTRVAAKSSGAAKVRINGKAIAELLKSDAVLGDVVARADRIAEACGGKDIGYVRAVSVPKKRARAAVVTSTRHAIQHNAKHNTMIRNLDAGR